MTMMSPTLWPGWSAELARQVARPMDRTPVSAGVVHALPDDLRQVLVAEAAVLERWEGITPLARNEWICWVEDARKPDTRLRRIERASADLRSGKRRDL